MTTETILTILGIVVGSNALFGFVQFMISRHDGKRKAMHDLQQAVSKLQSTMDENTTNMAKQSEALMSLAQDRILYLAKCFIKQKWISAEDYKNLKRMADSYRELGGNDLVKVYMDMVDDLPKKAEGEKK